MQIVLLILGLIVAGIAVIFAAQNAESTNIVFFNLTANMPKAVALLIAMVLGALISLFVAVPSIGRSKIANRKHRKKVTELETKLSESKTKLSQAEQKIKELEQKLSDILNTVKPSSSEKPVSIPATSTPSKPVDSTANTEKPPQG